MYKLKRSIGMVINYNIQLQLRSMFWYIILGDQFSLSCSVMFHCTVSSNNKDNKRERINITNSEEVDQLGIELVKSNI